MHRHGLQPVTEGTQMGLHLIQILAVGAGGQAHIDRFTHHQHVPAIQCAGCLDREQLPVGAERPGNAFGLRLARDGSRAGDQRTLVQHDGHILHEDRIGQVRLSR